MYYDRVLVHLQGLKYCTSTFLLNNCLWNKAPIVACKRIILLLKDVIVRDCVYCIEIISQLGVYGAVCSKKTLAFNKICQCYALRLFNAIQ